MLRVWAIRSIAIALIWFVLDSLTATEIIKLDEWITRKTAQMVGFCTQVFGYSGVQISKAFQGYSICGNEDARVFIGHACNARLIYFLYIAFITSVPLGSILRKVKYLLLGILLIYGFNVIRVFGLYCMAQDLPALFRFSHKYLFQVSIYLLLFFLWHNYLKPFSPSAHE